MNVNSPEFVPSSRRESVYYESGKDRFQRSKQFNGGRRSIIAVNQHLPQWVLTQIYVWPSTIWRVRGYEHDTVQQFSSNGSHQEQTLGKDETGSVIGNEFAINHGQKTANAKGQSGKGQRSGGGSINKRHDKGHAQHPWLVTTLKGHTDEIRDIGFSSNGKFLASCAEDNIITSSHNTGHRNSATSDLTTSDDVNSSSSNEDIATTYQIKEKVKKTSKSGRNRRQKKNQQHYSMEIDDEGKENQQPTAKVISNSSLRKQVKSPATPLAAANATKGQGTTVVNIDNFTKISRAVTPPLRQHTKLNLHESELVKFLRYYVIDPAQLRLYGYPVESSIHPDLTEIFKHPPRLYTNKSSTYSNHTYDIINKNDGLNKRCNWDDNNSDIIQISGDSGQGSGSSSPPSVDSDSSENGEEEVSSSFYSTDSSYVQQFLYSSLEKKCARCKSSFYVTDSGEYLTQDTCVYHWGKITQTYKGGSGFYTHYSCCSNSPSTDGCSNNRLHVWSGVSVGVNGPFENFVQTQPPNPNSSNSGAKIYALDCEMCFTGLGLEVAKVTVVGADGQLVYEHYVRPESEVVDYNTRFSGITEKHLNPKNGYVKTLKEVQRDLLEIITSETILIGHALENDLRVLRILHKNIIDTSIAFPHSSGFPYRRGLKSLTKTYLKRDIQMCDSGHSSFEDSRACLELMLWRVRKDFRAALEQ